MKHLVIYIIILINNSWLIAQENIENDKTLTISKELNFGSNVTNKYSVLQSDEKTLHGKYTTYYYNKLLKEGFFENGNKEGIWKTYYITNKLMTEEIYSNNKRNGVCKYYYNNGQLITELYFENDSMKGNSTGYFKNGALARETIMIGTDKVKETLYYPNGKIEMEIKYLNNKVDTFRKYFSNGKLHQSILHLEGSPWTINSTFDINGDSINGGTLFNGSGTLISYRHYNVKENEKIKVYSIQNYLNGKKEGAGVSYDCEGKMEEKRLYRNDSLITSKEMNDDYDITTKKKYNFFTCSDEDDITSVEVMPEYPGGLEWLLKYLGNISYPPVARENDIEGTVYIRFVIDRNGQILNPEVIRGADKILNDAALLHIIRMPGWSMGIQRAMPIKVNYVVPIRFKLF